MERTRIDWFQLFVQLQKSGWPLERVSKTTRIARTTMIGWRQGSEPRHADGEVVIALWKKATGKKRVSLPLERWFQKGR